MRRQLLPMLVALGLLAPVKSAFGWGETGHRAVGAIATKYLNENARRYVTTLLGEWTLAEVSTWPDELRSDPRYDHTLPWHFVDLTDGTAYDPKRASPKGDLVTALADMERTLRDAKAPVDKRREALKYLVHFIADIHQPLHNGNGKDMGGNVCEVTVFGQPSNLHAAIDSGILDSTKLSFTELAAFSDRATEAERTRWQRELDPLAWIQEAVPLREALYPDEVDSKKSPESKKLSREELAKAAKRRATMLRAYCKQDKQDTIPNGLKPALGYEYRYKHLASLQRQLLKAGLRTAGLLNAIADAASK